MSSRSAVIIFWKAHERIYFLSKTNNVHSLIIFYLKTANTFIWLPIGVNLLEREGCFCYFCHSVEKVISHFQGKVEMRAGDRALKF